MRGNQDNAQADGTLLVLRASASVEPLDYDLADGITLADAAPFENPVSLPNHLVSHPSYHSGQHVADRSLRVLQVEAEVAVPQDEMSLASRDAPTVQRELPPPRLSRER